MTASPAFPTTGDRAAVLLRLDGAALSVQDAIECIQSACDRAEDAGAHGVLLVHVVDCARALVPGGMDMPLMSQWERALKRIEGLRVPTVCVVDGACTGLMLDVLLCTDYRIATPGCELAMARVADTLWPGMAIHRLANQVGVASARALVLFDRGIGAAEALRHGLLHDVAADPMAAAQAFVASLSGLHLPDVPVRRQLLVEAAGAAHETVLGAHMAVCDRALRRLPASAAAGEVVVPGAMAASPAMAFANS